MMRTREWGNIISLRKTVERKETNITITYTRKHTHTQRKECWLQLQRVNDSVFIQWPKRPSSLQLLTAVFSLVLLRFPPTPNICKRLTTFNSFIHSINYIWKFWNQTSWDKTRVPTTSRLWSGYSIAIFLSFVIYKIEIITTYIS